MYANAKIKVYLRLYSQYVPVVLLRHMLSARYEFLMETESKAVDLVHSAILETRCIE